MISSPHAKFITHYQMPCTAAISGSTSDIRALLESQGFRWHTARRNWYKFGDNLETLKEECLKIWGAHPGKILFEVIQRGK